MPLKITSRSRKRHRKNMSIYQVNTQKISIRRSRSRSRSKSRRHSKNRSRRIQERKTEKLKGGVCSDVVDPISYENLADIPQIFRLNVPFIVANGAIPSVEHCRDVRQIARDFRHGYTKNFSTQTEYSDDQLLFIYTFLSSLITDFNITSHVIAQEDLQNLLFFQIRVFNALVFQYFRTLDIARFDFIMTLPTSTSIRNQQKKKFYYEGPSKYGPPPAGIYKTSTLIDYVLFSGEMAEGARFPFFQRLVQYLGFSLEDARQALSSITFEQSYITNDGKKDAEDVQIVRFILEHQYVPDHDGYIFHAYNDELNWLQMLVFQSGDIQPFDINLYPYEILIIDLFGEHGYMINPPIGSVINDVFDFVEEISTNDPLNLDDYIHRLCGCIEQVWIPRGLKLNAYMLLGNGYTPLASANNLLGSPNELSSLLIANGAAV